MIIIVRILFLSLFIFNSTRAAFSPDQNGGIEQEINTQTAPIADNTTSSDEQTTELEQGANLQDNTFLGTVRHYYKNAQEYYKKVGQKKALLGLGVTIAASGLAIATIRRAFRDSTESNNSSLGRANEGNRVSRKQVTNEIEETDEEIKEKILKTLKELKPEEKSRLIFATGKLRIKMLRRLKQNRENLEKMRENLKGASE